jgi:hypothetical protein
VSCWNSALLLLTCALAHAHVVSISNGELRVTGRTASFELRMPAYEVEAVSNPEALLDELRFGTAHRTSAECNKDADWLTCRAAYEFPEPVPDKLEVACTLYRVTVPNHIHMLYAVQGENSDQRVFDQSNPALEIRFHPPSLSESVTRDGSAGALRLLKSPSGLLFLLVIALAARSWREAALLTVVFVAVEWLVRPLSPFIPLAMSPEFLESVMALTVAYLAGELLFLPQSSARWFVVPLLGLVHGLPFVAFPPLYLAGAALVQILLLALAAAASLRIPPHWNRPLAAAALLAALAWFTRLLFA